MSKWTNDENLPYTVVKAATAQTYTKGDADFSVTELIGPPRLSQLVRRNPERITRDIADEIPSMMGRALHALFEPFVDPKDMAEQIMRLEVDGAEIGRPGEKYIIKGQPDLFSSVEDMTLFDYKFTSVWAWILGGKDEWDSQLNIYAYMLKVLKSIEPKRAEVVGLWKDWKKADARTTQDYPRRNSTKVAVKLWPEEIQKRYLLERLKMHVEARALKQEDLPLCNDKDRWARGEAWAVIKKGNVKAMNGGVFRLEEFAGDKEATAAAAQKMADANGALVQHRPPVYGRCLDWCDAATFCTQFIETQEAAAQAAQEKA